MSLLTATWYIVLYDIYLTVCNSADHCNRLEGLIELIVDGARGVVEISASRQVLASFAMPPGESVRLAWCGWQGSQIVAAASFAAAPSVAATAVSSSQGALSGSIAAC